MKLVLAVAAGGGLEAVARYLLGSQIAAWSSSGFPWGRFRVNVIGCTAMGVLAELMAVRWAAPMELRAFLTTALDTGLLAERDQPGLAAAYVVGSVAPSLLGFYVGLRCVRYVLT